MTGLTYGRPRPGSENQCRVGRRIVSILRGYSHPDAVETGAKGELAGETRSRFAMCRRPLPSE